MKPITEAIQDEYPEDFSWCYGCGRKNEQGYHFRTGWDGDQTLTIYTPREEHTALPGFVYGGLIASLIDCHGTGSASLALHRKNGHEPGDNVEPPRFVTGSLHIDFIKPTPKNGALQAVGTVEEVHPKKFNVHTQVFAEGKVCAKGKVVAVVMPTGFLEK